MPQVRKLTGNHREVVTAVFSSKYAPPTRMASGKIRYPVAEALKQSSYQVNVDNIFTDLTRTAFLPTNGKTGDNFVRAWANTPSYDFAQGNITASLYHFLFTLFIANPDFVKEDTGRKEEEQFTKYYANAKKVDFAYYNDEGVLCGVSLSYCTEDPSLWTACTMRNTVGKPEDREVFFLSTAELIKHDTADKQKELVESDTVAQEFLAFLKSKDVAALFADTILADGNVNVARLETLNTYLQEMHLINISDNTVFQAREAQFKQLAEKKEKTLKPIKNPALDLAAQQSFARRNAGSLFLGFLVLVTLVNLVLIATGVLAPLGFILEGVKNYLALGGAAAVGVVSAANLANNEQQLSTYQARIQGIEQDFEKENRAAFIALDTKEADEALRAKQEAEEALRERQEAEKALLEQQVLVPGMGEAVNHTHEEDDANSFGVVGELVDEVVRDDSQLTEATILVESVSEKPPVISSQKGLGVVIPKDGMVIPTDEGTLTYS